MVSKRLGHCFTPNMFTVCPDTYPCSTGGKKLFPQAVHLKLAQSSPKASLLGGVGSVPATPGLCLAKPPRAAAVG